ncbi:MAG: spore coat U domain-containing protein [Porticoccaceae bacterium]|nr:spore coat U domain-containing protein [Porticoccaceae bacterium]
MKTKLKLKLAIASAIVAGAMGLSATSYAATTTGSMAVTAEVAMSCAITTGEMAFGTYDPTSTTALDATATITSTCTSGGATIMTMGKGSNYLPTSTDAIPLRRMSDGAAGDFPQMLDYHLYSDSAGGTVWGNTDSTGKAITATGTAQAITVYGQITAQQSVSEASFSDSVLVTLSY